MKKSLFCAAILIAMGLILTSVGFGQSHVLGGYKAIDTSDEGAAEAADFAIKAQSEKTEMEYELGGVVKAERQVVGGTNYRLCMDVSANGEDGSYAQAVVYVDLKQNYKLTSWIDSDCGAGLEGASGMKGAARKGSAADGYKAIAKTDAGAGLAADFAVKAAAAKTKTKLTFGEVVKAGNKGGKGSSGNFRLCIGYSGDSDKTSFVRATVSVDQYSNYKLIGWTASDCGGH